MGKNNSKLQTICAICGKGHKRGELFTIREAWIQAGGWGSIPEHARVHVGCDKKEQSKRLPYRATIKKANDYHKLKPSKRDRATPLIGYEMSEDGKTYPIVGVLRDKETGFCEFWCSHCRCNHYHGQGDGHRGKHCHKPNTLFAHGYILHTVSEHEYYQLLKKNCPTDQLFDVVFKRIDARGEKLTGVILTNEEITRELSIFAAMNIKM